MKLSIQSKGIVLGAISAFAALALAVPASEAFQSAPGTSSADGDGLAIPPAGSPEQKGQALFMMNCATATARTRAAMKVRICTV